MTTKAAPPGCPPQRPSLRYWWEGLWWLGWRGCGADQKRVTRERRLPRHAAVVSRVLTHDSCGHEPSTSPQASRWWGWNECCARVCGVAEVRVRVLGAEVWAGQAEGSRAGRWQGSSNAVSRNGSTKLLCPLSHSLLSPLSPPPSPLLFRAVVRTLKAPTVQLQGTHAGTSLKHYGKAGIPTMGYINNRE